MSMEKYAKKREPGLRAAAEAAAARLEHAIHASSTCSGYVPQAVGADSDGPASHRLARLEGKEWKIEPIEGLGDIGTGAGGIARIIGGSNVLESRDKGKPRKKVGTLRDTGKLRFHRLFVDDSHPDIPLFLPESKQSGKSSYGGEYRTWVARRLAGRP